MKKKYKHNYHHMPYCEVIISKLYVQKAHTFAMMPREQFSLFFLFQFTTVQNSPTSRPSTSSTLIKTVSLWCGCTGMARERAIRYKFEIQHISWRQKLEWGRRERATLFCLYEKDDGFFGCTAPKNNTTTISEEEDDDDEEQQAREKNWRTNHRLVIASFTYCENNVILTRVGQLAPKHHHCFRIPPSSTSSKSPLCCLFSLLSPSRCAFSPLSDRVKLSVKSGKLYFSFSGWIIIVWRRTTR